MSGARAGETKRAEDVRSRLPRGATKIRIVRLFVRGLSIQKIAGLIGCLAFVIEDVIRDAMRKSA